MAPMAILFSCPSGHRLSAEERHGGRRLRCPKCDQLTRIPRSTRKGQEKAGQALRKTPPPLPQRPAEVHLAVTTAVQAEPAVEVASPVVDSSATDAAAAMAPIHVMPYQGYHFSAKTVYWIAAGLALLTMFHLGPVFKLGELHDAPTWTYVILLMAAVQLTYVVWMALIPHWSTVWVGMLVFSGVATLYGAALAVAIITPRDQQTLLDFDETRDVARMWCLAAIVVTLGMTFVCGRVSFLWRKTLEAAANA